MNDFLKDVCLRAIMSLIVILPTVPVYFALVAICDFSLIGSPVGMLCRIVAAVIGSGFILLSACMLLRVVLCSRETLQTILKV